MRWQLTPPSRHLVAVAHRHLQGLVAGIGETVHLCVLRAGDVVTLASEVAPHAFRGPEWEGTTVSAPRHLRRPRPAVRLAAGEPQGVVGPTPTAATHHSCRALGAVHGRNGSSEQLVHTSRLQTYPELVTELVRIRQQGYAMVDEEFEPGLVGGSAPVRDFRGRIVAALNVSAPKHRLGPLLERAGVVTARTAVTLSTDLGWVQPRPGTAHRS